MIEEIQRRWDSWETLQTCQQSMLTLIQQNAPLTACDFHPSTLFKINGRGIFIWKYVSNSVEPRLTQGGKKLWKNGSVNTLQKLVVVESLSHVWLFESPQTAARWASLSFTISWSLFKLMSIESVMPSSHLTLCRPLVLLPSIFSTTGVFSNESALWMRWTKYWSFSFSISPSSKQSGLISFRIGWLDLLAVQGTLKILLQHHSSKASILQPSTFFMVGLSHPYMTTGKSIALTIWTFSDQAMSLLFNILLFLPEIFFQGACVFYFCGCSHQPQWLRSPRKLNLSLLPLFPHLLAMKWWAWMYFECWIFFFLNVEF